MECSKPIARRQGLEGLGFAILLALACAGRAPAQIPGLTPSGNAAPAKEDAKGKPAGSVTKDNLHGTIATPSGPIQVERPVDDRAVRETLRELLPRFPGVRNVDITVKDGVVTLEGQVEGDDDLEDVTQFTSRVEGVRLVLNRMKTDAEVLSGRQLAAKVLREFATTISKKWLLAAIALAIVLAFLGLARLFGGRSETLLSPFISNVLLRSVVGSILSSALVVGGIMLALSVLNLTHVVLSILGLAGVVGLAVGFAFRDIAENFIASILLGVRRPFRIGDYIKVAGQAGVVLSLNTRATILVTLEGNHVRIPNNIIYKEIMVNTSASTNVRGGFDVVIPYEVSTAAALEAMAGALREQEGILPDPPARALVEALEGNGVRLRAYYWTPAQGVDGDKLTSDIKLRVKVALQKAGIAPPPLGVTLSVAGHVPVEVSEVDGQARHDVGIRPCAIVTAEQAQANLRQDTQAAEAIADAPPEDRPTPIEHALSQAGDGAAAAEGTNLLSNGQAAH